MPSFADLKAKAAGVTNSGVEKLHHVKDRNTSVPLKKTNWDPYSGKPPPPPPPPKPSAASKPHVLAPLPPPPRRTSSLSTPVETLPPPIAPSIRPSSVTKPPPLPGRATSSASPALPPRAPSSVPPPPPARRTSTSSPTATPPAFGPPPVVRTSRPDFASRQVAPTYHEEPEQEVEEAEHPTTIDWLNLSEEDKQTFFSWLDEFFAKFLNVSIPPASTVGTVKRHTPPTQAPPPVRAASKPNSWNRTTVGTASDYPDSNFTLSHPPPTTHGSSALDLAYYFSPSTIWPEQPPWYTVSSTSNALPPPLKGNTNLTWSTVMQTYGPTKTMYYGILFSDLSVFWGSIEFNSSKPNETCNVKRDAMYLPRPKARSKAELINASQTYGDTIASFAESFLESNEYCGDGECWTLASEALKYFTQYDYIPNPIPSISRTHGHLIYEAKAQKSTTGKTETVGRWRGGDDRIRRGDIVEWRRVRINILNAPPGNYFTLGDPDHTAIVVEELAPGVPVMDGKSLKPADLGTLVVVEQSVGSPPAKTGYDLIGLEEGEMWIYRPIGMEAYLGVAQVVGKAPEGVSALRL